MLQILVVQKNPCSTYAPKHPHSAWCYKKKIMNLTATLKPHGRCQMLSFQIHLCTQGGERDRERYGHEAEKQILPIKDVGKTGHCNVFI
jgi:hypothetical protein